MHLQDCKTTNITKENLVTQLSIYVYTHITIYLEKHVFMYKRIETFFYNILICLHMYLFVAMLNICQKLRAVTTLQLTGVR